MADVKISALALNSSPAGTDVVPVSKADGSATNKVTLQAIADLAVSGGIAVGSDTTGITGASTVTNIVQLTQAQYDALSTYDNNTAYIIVG